MFWLYINVLFYLEKKQRNVYKHMINLMNTVVRYCNH